MTTAFMSEKQDVQPISSPRISVVTVVYNDVDHIEQTMLTVLNQTYKNIEYIIIDGGSTDGTVEKIKKYADRLAYWKSEKDAGIADAMNKGIDHATGTWLNYINSGDYFISNTVFEEIFSRPHTADMLYGSFVTTFSGRWVQCIATDVKTILEKTWQGMQICHTTLFASVAVLKKFKFQTTYYRVSADGEFVTHCVAAGCSFERLDHIIFRVGTVGNSANHWLRGRIENWEIARKYFPSWKTNYFHATRLLREVTFRTFKWLASLTGLYQLARSIYRKKLQSKIPLLPPNCVPYENS